MKRLIQFALLFTATILAIDWGGGTMVMAQPTNPSIVWVSTAPSGACTNGATLQAVISTGSLYSCQSLTWAAVGPSGGGGGTLTGTGTNGFFTCWTASATVLGNCIMDFAATSAATLTTAFPGTTNSNAAFLQGSLATNNNVNISAGKSVAAHQSVFFGWHNATVPFASIQTFAEGDQVEIAGSVVALDGGNVYVGNSNGGSGSADPSGGGLFNVGTTNQFQVSAAGAVTALTTTVATARRGTFVCTNAGTITISNANYAAGSDVTITMNTAGGTITTPPAFKTVTAGTGFTVLCGATDTSTYRYTIWN